MKLLPSKYLDYTVRINPVYYVFPCSQYKLELS